MASLKNNTIPRSSDDDGVSDDLGPPPLKKFRRVSMEQHNSSEGENDNNKFSPEGDSCIQQRQSTFLKRRRVTLDEQGFINACSSASASASSSNKKLKLSSTSSSSSFSSNPTIQNDEENNSVSSSISDPLSTENDEAVEVAPCTVLTTETTTSTEDDERVDVEELETTPATGIVTPHPSSLDLIETDTSTRNEEEMISINAAQTEAEEKHKVKSAFVSCVDEAVLMRESPTVKSMEYQEQQQQQHVGSRINFLLTSKRSIFLQLLVQLLMLVSYLHHKQSSSQLSFPSQDCIYVTGGGFSGFWFSMGRLQSIPEPKAHNYVCYSAGCLGSVATLSNITVDELYDIASTARDEFLRGERHRYDIVEYFVDNMLDKIVASHQESELINSFDKLHILTSVTDPKTKFPMSQMQSPTSMRHLKDLLIETTWIPIAIGSHYSHKGHLDGAFSHFQHPKCNHKIGLAWDIDLYLNALNPNINAKKVTKFWNLGLDYGL